MFPIERGGGIHTTCLRGVRRRIERKPKMIHLHGIGLDARGCLRDDGGRLGKLIYRRRYARGNNEGLPTEAADEIADPDAAPIGRNVTHVPGDPERCGRNLNYEKVEDGIRRQIIDHHHEIFDIPDSMNDDVGRGSLLCAAGMSSRPPTPSSGTRWSATVRLCLGGSERRNRRRDGNIWLHVAGPFLKYASHFRRNRKPA